MCFSTFSDRVTVRFLELGRGPLGTALEDPPVEELESDVEGEFGSCL